ncbi:DUF962-domain-containing protein [Basidiobolus meristosporus CBS 931.73]|uniref:DUF962-domain-containing protein n=1 Tax=Basidiobolus meristosporus CBS 931.73 TaxID=1314790 RepID=A0A1Y1XY74_9FUNG|nr:DUF962-domain-containing protein [Basidiobolus meristosporus CBS 931.73]ORY01385.1 DUF962-domain-containing protein [Basidiobolus meristosporus CBS 931.73]|eukprot:ORX90691.1 DUF962-domain-containing protein [Basidiobolus meristosporus CBS 931.73]
MSFFNFESQFTFYGQYHSNKVNVICHVVCVPLIYWSALVLSMNVGLLTTTEVFGNVYLPAVVSLAYSLFYIYLEPVAGLMYTPILGGIAYHATNFYQTSPQANNIAIAIHIFAWICQFYTHAFHEKRAPALLDNIAQALLFAPFFVFFEIIFQLGYRPSFKRRLQNNIGKAITIYRRQLKNQGKKARS